MAWDIFWGDINAFLSDRGFVHAALKDHQRINHFPRQALGGPPSPGHRGSCLPPCLNPPCRNYELCRKDLMAKNIKKARRLLDKQGRGQEMDFIPQTFVLPSEWGMFADEFKNGRSGLWIAKPAGRAQGKGIFMVEKLSQLSQWKRPAPADYSSRSYQSGSRPRSAREEEDEEAELYVLQRYVDRPLLVCGRKFDMRIYLLVLSFTPLHVYLHR